MNIKNYDYYISQLWDWSFLNDCFGNTKIRVTDIDGFVERKGKFLVIECKSNDAEIPEGQRIMFDAMTKTGLFTVLVVWGEANSPERAWVFGRRGITVYKYFTEQNFTDFVKGWFNYANKEVTR